jgi:hypothetical protein
MHMQGMESSEVVDVVQNVWMCVIAREWVSCAIIVRCVCVRGSSD